MTLEEYVAPESLKPEPVVYKRGHSTAEDYPYMKDDGDDTNA